ncbi:MAG: tol-pal system protein YbgF [Gammaproteobacteria bacterium]
MKKNRYTILLPLFLISASSFAGETGTDIQSRINKLERAVDNRGLLNILNELKSLQTEVRELRGEVEQQAYTIEQMKKRQQNLYNDLDQRLQSGSGQIDSDQMTVSSESKKAPLEVEIVEGSNTPTSSPAVEVSVREKPQIDSDQNSAIQPVETYVAKSANQTHPDQQASQEVNAADYPQQAVETANGSNEEDDYSEAFALLKQGKHEKARDKFREFLKQYPDSQYADNAQYWLGEAYYAKRDFESAIKEYKLLMSHYPESGKLSHAQLKIGYCYDELGQTDYARGELEDLIARYPGTSAANLAEQRLSRIR